MDRSRQIWESLGKRDAYFAVASFDEYKHENLDDAAKGRFFEGGREYIENLWKEFEQGFGRMDGPRRALDYGCGVGRILIPLAGRCEGVIGVDISAAMLSETRKNCVERELTNVELQSTDEFNAATNDKYDLVHSYIVLQHVKPAIGEKIIRTMVERLNDCGLGMIHVTFFNPGKGFQKLRTRLYRDVPFLHRFLSRMRGIHSRFMPMYEYKLNDVFLILEQNGCDECFVRFTDHGFLGAMIFFRMRGRTAS